jgi:hypothetical protein
MRTGQVQMRTGLCLLGLVLFPCQTFASTQEEEGPWTLYQSRETPISPPADLIVWTRDRVLYTHRYSSLKVCESIRASIIEKGQRATDAYNDAHPYQWSGSSTPGLTCIPLERRKR